MSCLLLKWGAFLAGWLRDHHYHPTLSVHTRTHTNAVWFPQHPHFHSSSFSLVRIAEHFAPNSPSHPRVCSPLCCSIYFWTWQELFASPVLQFPRPTGLLHTLCPLGLDLPGWALLSECLDRFMDGFQAWTAASPHPQLSRLHPPSTRYKLN